MSALLASRRSSEVVVLYGCCWRSIEEYGVGVGVHRDFGYPHYLLLASENNGCIAISVSFGLSQSGCGWTACN